MGIEGVVFVSILILLVLIGIQDWKRREIDILLLIGFGGLGLLRAYLNLEVMTAGVFFALNCSFILLQLILVTIYFSLRRGEFVWIPDNMLGWGDIVFLLICGFLFAPGWFMLFYTFALIISLFGAIIQGFGKENSEKTIPLVTGLSTVLFFILLLGDFLKIDFYEFALIY